MAQARLEMARNGSDRREGVDKRPGRQALSQAPFSAPEDEALALATLRAVMRSKNAPSSARAQAARSVLEACGRLGKNAAPSVTRDAPAAEISLANLEARILALETPSTVTESLARQAPGAAPAVPAPTAPGVAPAAPGGARDA